MGFKIYKRVVAEGHGQMTPINKIIVKGTNKTII